MHWPSQTGWLTWSVEGWSCLSSSLAKMYGSSPDHVFCPSSERMLMSVAALSTKRKAGLGRGARRARRGRRSISLPLSAPHPVVGASATGVVLDFSRDDGRVHMTTLSSF